MVMFSSEFSPRIVIFPSTLELDINLVFVSESLSLCSLKYFNVSLVRVCRSLSFMESRTMSSANKIMGMMRLGVKGIPTSKCRIRVDKDWMVVVYLPIVVCSS